MMVSIFLFVLSLSVYTGAAPLESEYGQDICYGDDCQRLVVDLLRKLTISGNNMTTILSNLNSFLFYSIGYDSTSPNHNVSIGVLLEHLNKQVKLDLMNYMSTLSSGAEKNTDLLNELLKIMSSMTSDAQTAHGDALLNYREQRLILKSICGLTESLYANMQLQNSELRRMGNCVVILMVCVIIIILRKPVVVYLMNTAHYCNAVKCCLRCRLSNEHLGQTTSTEHRGGIGLTPMRGHQLPTELRGLSMPTEYRCYCSLEYQGTGAHHHPEVTYDSEPHDTLALTIECHGCERCASLPRSPDLTPNSDAAETCHLQNNDLQKSGSSGSLSQLSALGDWELGESDTLFELGNVATA